MANVITSWKYRQYNWVWRRNAYF